MAKIKTFIKAFIPPIVNHFFKLLVTSNVPVKNIWVGNFANWHEAKKTSTGYDQLQILEKCKNALLKVKSGEAKFERDSVLFDTIQYSWPLLAALQKIALENSGNLCVIDFGGSLGSSFFQNRSFLNGITKIKWCIIEQPHFVDYGKKYFQNEELLFYHSIDDCLKEQQPKLLLLNSVLPYIEKSYELIQQIITYNIDYIFMDRTSFIAEAEDRITLQTVPPEIYDASYPCWFFNEKRLLTQFLLKYNQIADFDCNGTTTPFLAEDKKLMYWKGWFLKIF